MRASIKLMLIFAAAVAQLGGCSATGPVARPDAHAGAQASEARRAQELFEAYWEETAQLYPEMGTYRGDHRLGDRLADRSPEGIAREDAYWRSLVQRVASLDTSQLGAKDRLSADILRRMATYRVLLQQFDGYQAMGKLVGSFGLESEFAELLMASPAENAKQVEQMLARMAAYPGRLDHEIALVRSGIQKGWVLARPSLEFILAQLDEQLAAPIEKNPYFEPFTRLGEAIPRVERDALRTRGARAVSEQVLPAVRRVRDFIATEYIAAAPADAALMRYPEGDLVYAALVRIHTNTSLTPQQIHQIGLREVASLRGQMESVMLGTGFQGDFSAFVRFLNSDSKFFHGSGDELLAGYRDIAKRIDPELPRLFMELPRVPYGVRPMPDYMGPTATEYYSQPSIDGTRPGWFNANAVGFKLRPKWRMEAWVAHEAVPGHHLQIATAAELRELPAFRRDAFFTAFAEGWGTYAETLGDALGLYKDPYSRFGQLQFQIWRATRLVVDTGIHALGWSRQQAIDYMVERTGMDRGQLTFEVDRYYVWPGQALAYMIGQLKIIELRERAKAALGERFDIRRFHKAVLGSGGIPLDVLESQIDEWIAATKSQAARQ